MNTIQQFAEEVMKRVKNYLPTEHQDVQCEIIEQQKNNGVYRTGVSFRKEGEAVGLNVYMNSYFEAYKEGWPLDEIMKDMTSQVMKGFEDRHMISIDQIGCFEAVKDLLVPVVINTRANRQRLKDMPHMRIEDLSVICQIQFPMEEGVGSIKVTDEVLKQWGIGKEQLFNQTFENAKKPGTWKLCSMESCITEICGGEATQTNLLDVSDDYLQKKRGDFPMYVLSNTDRTNGAAAMVCPGVMEKVDRLFPEGFRILPSSIHECLIIPKTDDMDTKKLREMVNEVNQTQVQAEEVLSDNVYEYDRERGKIRQAADSMERRKEMER